MKRFSVEVDHDFEIGGEVFRWVYPYWEDIAAVFDRDEQDESANGDQSLTVRATIEDFIERIELFIDPDFQDGRFRWQELTKRQKNPVPHAQYAELYRWLLEVTSNPHPTEPSSPSEDGPQATEPTSTAESSSRVATRR